jgi:hypothetical protein
MLVFGDQHQRVFSSSSACGELRYYLLDEDLQAGPVKRTTLALDIQPNCLWLHEYLAIPEIWLSGDILSIPFLELSVWVLEMSSEAWYYVCQTLVVPQS